MPLLILPILILLVIFTVAALIPVSLVQRYRLSTSRQRARGWLVTINVAGLVLSAILFITSAAVTSFWVPGALTYALGGLAAGAVLGIVGLRLTQWDPSPAALHYTPNRLLALGVMLIVVARLIYGFWRGWHSWRAGLHGESWLVAAGVAGSMAAGAVVLGYYLTYWIGVRRRFRRHAARRLRSM